MWIISVIIIIVFFALSAFFSGIETGLISIDRLKMEQAAKTDKKKKQILDFLVNPDRLFGTTLFGNNISVVIISSLSIYLVRLLRESDQLDISEHLVTLITAGLVLVFAEIIPKAVYRDNPNLMVTRGFSLLRFFSLIFYPFIKFVSAFNVLLARLFHLPANNGYHILTRDDISYMLAEAKDDDLLHEDQREMLEDALEFTDLDAENIMVHRTEIIAFDKSTPIPEVLNIAREHGFTRYPVFDCDLDHIIGQLIIYDLMKNMNNSETVAGDFVREVIFAPETTDVDHLLAEMQSHKKSMAIIVDAFGGTAGLVTIEDILEEIVGEIEDEYDTDVPEIEKIDENTFRMPGYVEIDFLNSEYDLDLPEGNYETIAGLIIDRLERIPKQGTQISAGNWLIKILQGTDKKIIRVEIRNQNPTNVKN
ncbi:MAG TPA: hemolysin family protein [Candidatus Cloacimonadota bacterium]|nr:hemolysin family protein [Candidatus Cloacimonadota bacterium]